MGDYSIAKLILIDIGNVSYPPLAYYVQIWQTLIVE